MKTHPDNDSVPEKPSPAKASDPRTEAIKASYRQAWFIFLMVICFLVAWWYPAQTLIRRYTAARVKAEGPRDSDCFVTLAFEGISDLPEEVSLKQFRNHIEALRKANYHPITLGEVRSLLDEGRLLPRRSILITFDQSRKSSYFDARSTLRRAGWNAVMFLWTRPIEEADPSSLRWPYIRQMLDGGLWEVGAQSHAGFAQIPAGPANGAGNFFSTPRWIVSESRYETPEEFHSRLLDDHNFCRELITREARREPAAFAFPYGDFGQYDQRAVLTRRLNLELVGKHYALGFILGSNALNTRESDPRRLNRLLVQPGWTSEELLNRLEHAWPRPEGYSGKSLMEDPLSWLPDWGDVHFTDGRIVLAATTKTTGAKAWINGSATSLNTQLSFLAGLSGQLGVFLRATQDNEAYIYLGLDNRGRVWLRQKHVGMQPFTLASGNVMLNTGEPARVEVTIRDRLLFVQINGRQPFSEAIRIHGQARNGMIGFSVWDEHPGAAWAELKQIRALHLYPTVFSWDSPPPHETDLSMWMNNNAYRYSGMAPLWLKIGHRGPLTHIGWEPDFLKTLASIYHMELLPEVLLEAGDAFSTISPEQLAERAAEQKTDGITLNLAGIPSALPLTQSAGWIQQLGGELAERGMNLLIRLPASLEKAGTLPSMLARIPNTRIGSSTSPTNRNKRFPDGMRSVTVDEVEIPPSNFDLSLYYEIADLDDVSTQDHGKEAHGETLRRQGHAAFNAGDFDQAIQIWKKWAEIDPANEQAANLIGDGYLRQGEVALARQFYARSLDINPGQISLAMRYVRLLENNGEEDEALGILNRYARIFPGLPDVALAQSEWLIRHGRKEKALDIIRRNAEQHPNDLRPLAMLQGIMESPEDRYNLFHRMLELGNLPGMENQLAMAVRDNQLHLLQESWMLLPFLETNLTHAPPHQRSLFEELICNQEIAREDFRRRRISTRWESSVDPRDDPTDRFLLSTRPSEAEAYLRLKRSHGFSNGFIEADIEDARGFFWLYARRSDNGMIRFGFEQNGNMYLQVWKNGKLRVNANRPWARPRNKPLTLRLELRADGATGLVNGDPFFNAPVTVPRDLDLGWWGIAPYAPYLGQAQASLQELSAGPLPVRIALFRNPAPESLPDFYLTRLKPYARALSVVSPPWFYQGIDGTVTADEGARREDLRILCAYYKIRLLPAVRAAIPRLDVEKLHELAVTQNLDGFTLYMAQMPDEDWFQQIEPEVMSHPLDLLVMVVNEEKGIAEVREISPAWGLFGGKRETAILPLQRVTHASGDVSSGETFNENADSAVLYLEEDEPPSQVGE